MSLVNKSIDKAANNNMATASISQQRTEHNNEDLIITLVAAKITVELLSITNARKTIKSAAIIKLINNQLNVESKSYQIFNKFSYKKDRDKKRNIQIAILKQVKQEIINHQEQHSQLALFGLDTTDLIIQKIIKLIDKLNIVKNRPKPKLILHSIKHYFQRLKPPFIEKTSL